jgi:hypothetical protein
MLLEALKPSGPKIRCSKKRSASPKQPVLARRDRLQPLATDDLAPRESEDDEGLLVDLKATILDTHPLGYALTASVNPAFGRPAVASNSTSGSN